MRRWMEQHLIWLLLILCICLHFISAATGHLGKPIRADGVDYYVYLPSILLHGDPTLESAVAAGVPTLAVEREPETGRLINRYNVGVAIFLLPAFAVAHAVTWLMQTPGEPAWPILNYPLDGYSFFYQHAAALWGLLFFVGGLAVLRRFLAARFGAGIAALTVTVLALGTNILHYAAIETVLTHGYSFFFFACFLFLVERWYAKDRDWRTSLLLGLTIGTLILLRTMHGIALAVWALYGIRSWPDLPARVRLFWGRRLELVLMGLAIAAMFVPQMIVWKLSFGAWIVNSYGNLALPYLAEPFLWQVLFHVKKGLFLYFPVLMLVLPGLFVLRRTLPDWFFPVLAFTLLNYYLVASAATWYAGGGFGNRYFTEWYVFASMPLAALFSSSVPARVAIRGALAVFVCASLAWSLWFMKMYAAREIPVEGLDGPGLFDLIYSRKEMVDAWIRSSR